MVNLTISLSEEIVKRVRSVVRERYRSRRGALSGLIGEALREYLDSLESPKESRKFRAYTSRRLVAEADSLEELASKLRNLGLDPRSVRINSSTTLKTVVRAGLRARGA